MRFQKPFQRVQTRVLSSVYSNFQIYEVLSVHCRPQAFSEWRVPVSHDFQVIDTESHESVDVGIFRTSLDFWYLESRAIFIEYHYYGTVNSSVPVSRLTFFYDFLAVTKF